MPSTTYVASQPGPFAALLQAAELGGLQLDPMPPVRVQDVYLDTETGELLARGVVLRSRTLGAETTLTLRPLDGDGATYEVSADPSAPSALPPGALRDAVDQLAGGEPLTPILRLRQYRTPRIAYDRHRTVGLVSFDVVVYETDAGNVVANEVELEFSRAEDDVPRLHPVLLANGLEPAARSKMERGILRAHRALDRPVLLLPDERAALETLRADGTPEERRRAHVVLLDARGFSPQTLAEQTGTSQARVETVRRQFRSARMEAVRSGAVFEPGPPAPEHAPETVRDHDRVAGFDDLDALLESFHTAPDETPVLDGPPLASLDPVPVFVPTVGWDRSVSLTDVVPPDAAASGDAEWLPRAQPGMSAGLGFAREAEWADEDHRLLDDDVLDDDPIDLDSEHATPEPESSDPVTEPDTAHGAPGGWVAAAVAPADADGAPAAPHDAPASWLEAAIAPAAGGGPETAEWTRVDLGLPSFARVSVVGTPAAEPVDPFAEQAITLRDVPRQVDGDTPILEAAWLTIGHQVSAFEAATDALFRSGDARDARRLFLSAHRVRLALESFGPYLPDRAVERMTGALRRLVLTLDAAQDYARVVEAGGAHLEPVRDAHLESARRILEGGRQRAWGHRSRRLLGRLQAQGQEGLLIGDDFPAPPDDFIGEVGDRPVPSRLRHVLGSLVWRRYEDILAFEDDIEGDVSADLAYHLATAVSGLHFVLGLAEAATPEAARDLARVLDQAESLAAAYRHERRTAELNSGTGELQHTAAEVREAWRLLASPEFRQRLARVAVGV